MKLFPTKEKKKNILILPQVYDLELDHIEGFISIERFQSFSNPEKVLSLSFWKDEESIQQWRNLEMHRHAQSKGRNEIFKDYHLRIATVVRDYGMFDRKETPEDSSGFHDK